MFVYAVEAPEQLSRRIQVALRDQEIDLELSSVLLTEIAIKNAAGKLTLPAEVVRRALADLDIRVVPYSVEHAFRLFELPLHHRDPFDRQVIARGLAERIPIATPDKEFRRYEGLKVIW